MGEPSPLPVFHVVGFTGHRQLRDPEGEARKLDEVLAGLRARGAAVWIALSSAAEGADLVFARTARRLGLGWEALLPLPPADFRTDFSPAAWREVEALLAEAEHVQVVSETAPREDASVAQTWGRLERVVARVETTLLQEVFERHSLTSFSEAHRGGTPQRFRRRSAVVIRAGSQAAGS
ncbi:MAG: hypothetical protein RIR76_3609 [Verrucomicrobiota bacterium]|jgi:hypothetical protein